MLLHDTSKFLCILHQMPIDKSSRRIKEVSEQFIIFRSLEEVCSKKLHENKYLKLTFNNQKSNLGILYPFTNNKSLYKDTSYRKNLTIYSQKYYLTCCIKFEFFLQPKENPS